MCNIYLPLKNEFLSENKYNFKCNLKSLQHLEKPTLNLVTSLFQLKTVIRDVKPKPLFPV